MKTSLPIAPSRRAERPWTNLLEHGSYSDRTRFKVIQHTYWAGEEGFVEVVEIKDPPLGHGNVAIVYYDAREDYYKMVQWKDVASAVKAVNIHLSSVVRSPHEFPGFMSVEINKPGKKPWFYK